ncbi:ABC transporter ATP-binding protein [Cytobacillus purgationiresistens]|uniref:ABC-2 type transport system ATP-binding protein n=1 Tax=Cytobacillus purgationiresistens TaxID=863449 RepID=A0ABU0AL45_9BACI|nr:ABC transporter ATP-binding protein [Cytobacillus purgationiresistens]MDQ0271609.1 ABC-2 type transport system ATP-binding protein [Cytobacillus purgationiresistens]
MKYAIEVSGLTKTFGATTAVQHLSLRVKKGSIFGLLGHNGAGKSTTIDCILGTQKPSQGAIKILGMDPSKDRKQLFQNVGVQFQESAFQKGLKVKEICEITHSLYKNPLDWKEKLEMFGLSHRLKVKVSELSGGERQKLCILLAMMGQPDVIFLDELTTGLDPLARREVWSTLQNLKDLGVTIFLTSHFMDEVENLCDEILVLKNGQTLISGTVPEVIAYSGGKNMDDAFIKLIEGEFE